jgi:hypothetical protein
VVRRARLASWLIACVCAFNTVGSVDGIGWLRNDATGAWPSALVPGSARALGTAGELWKKANQCLTGDGEGCLPWLRGRGEQRDRLLTGSEDETLTLEKPLRTSTSLDWMESGRAGRPLGVNSSWSMEVLHRRIKTGAPPPPPPRRIHTHTCSPPSRAQRCGV